MINELVFRSVCWPAPITGVTSERLPPIAQTDLGEENAGTTSQTQTARCHCCGRFIFLLLALSPGPWLFDCTLVIRPSTCIVRTFSLLPWLVPGPGSWTTLPVFPTGPWFRLRLITSSHKTRWLAFHVGYGLSMTIHLK